jgi:phage gp36-like protein
MSYITREEIQNEIPALHLTEALDDDRDGVEDAGLFDALVAQASLQVDSYLASVFTVPFTGTTIPSTVRQAAYLFLGELIYARRPHVSAKNPFTDRADAMRKRLELIGTGKIAMDYATTPSQSPGAAITEAPSIDATLR